MSEKKKLTPQELLNEIEHCREEIAKNPNNTDIYFRLAHFLELNDNLSEAIQVYQTLTNKDPQNKKAYYRLGLCYNKSGFKNRAIDSLEAVIILEPDNLEIWCNLGYIYWENDNLTKAKLCYSKAYELDSKNGKILHSLSLLHYLLEEYPDALKIAKELEKNTPGSIENQLHLAMCYSAIEDYKKALLLYEKILAKNFDDVIFFNNYANCLKILKNFEKAEQYYLKSLEKEPENINFCFNYGEFLFEQNRKEKAISYFQEILRKNPEDTDCLQYLARIFEEKNPKEALKLYTKILKIEKSNVSVLNAIANIQEKFEMYKESVINRKKIYAIKKNHWENNLKLAQVYFKDKKIIEGWEMLKFNPLVTKEYLPLLEQIADSFCYYKKKLTEIDILQHIIKLDKKNYRAWTRLAEITLENGDIIRAYKYATKSENFLKSDVFFTGRLSQKLLGIGELEKAIEISHYLIETAKIDTFLLSAILKKFQQKKVIDKWLEFSKEKITTQKYLKKILENIFIEIDEQDKIKLLQEI